MPTKLVHSSNSHLSQRIAALPLLPGVYLMKNSEEKIIYVGKASVLRNRVRSYFQTLSTKEPKVRSMVKKIADFEFIVTASPQEALLLENLLIKKHKPYYNARLKDDKTYPYIKIDTREEFPQIYFTRRVNPDGAKYFGPFASASSVRKTMSLLKKLFPYRSCTKTITGNDDSPCLEYHIHRCIAPCTGKASKSEYHEVINQVVKFLQGDSEDIVRLIRGQMSEASEELQYEKAAILRDQISAIESVTERQKIVSQKNDDSDVIALANDNREAWVELFKIRKGKLIGREHFLMEGAYFENESWLIEQFMQQFYEVTNDIPKSILVQYPIPNTITVQEWLKSRIGHNVYVRCPQRGSNLQMITMAATNATEALNQRRLQWLSQSDKVLQAQVQLQESLNLPELPKRIECYDISNTQGTNSVGSMVVFENGKAKNSQYRRFQIKTVAQIDDYSSMREVLTRRFKRLGIASQQLVKERDNSSQADENYTIDSFTNIPQLVIIDGGRGHLNAALEVFLNLGIKNISLCSLAKRDEEVFLPDVPEPVYLDRNSPSLYLIQRIRDEAHRFAITYHRQRRSRLSIKSELDSAPGIGPVRKRVLLKKLGSLSGVRSATIEQIAEIEGMSLASATKLKEYLGGGN